MIGRQLRHYQIEAKLGQGGMGVVYRALDTHLDRPVAIKVLEADAVSNPERKKRFVMEAKAASALNHPNIVHVYDIDMADGVNFIAMEYVAGKTLDELTGRLVFASVSDRTDIWSLPLDANQGIVTGEPQRLTQDAADDVCPSASADGKKVAFISYRSGQRDVWIKDLETGKESSLTMSPAAEYYPTMSADGSKVAYQLEEKQKQTIWVAPLRGGMAQNACQDCGRPWHWSSNGQVLLYSTASPGGGPSGIASLDAGSGEKRDLLTHSGYGLYQSFFSADDRWICFLARLGPNRSRLFIAPYRTETPARESDWIAVTDGGSADDKPRWSPDGNLLYFMSRRDGSNCLWAQRLDHHSKRPAGPAKPVFHFHGARLAPGNVHNREFELSITNNRVVLPLGEVTGNIWMADLGGR